MERPLSTVASTPSDRTLPSGLRTARLATVSRLLKSGAPSQTHRRSRSAATFACSENRCVRNTDMLPTVTEENGKWKKTNKARWTFNVYHPRGCLLLALCECARAQREAAWECVCCVAGVVVFVCRVRWCNCAACDFVRCSFHIAVVCILLPRASLSSLLFSFFFVVRICRFFLRNWILGLLERLLQLQCCLLDSARSDSGTAHSRCCCAAAVFFMICSLSATDFSLEVSGTGIAFLVNTRWVFFFVAKERKDGFVPGEGERGSDQGATTVGRLTTLLCWSIKTQWRNNEFARSRRGGDDRNDGTVRGFGGFIGLSDRRPVACSSARASARSCGASNQSRIHHRPRHSICHVVHGACVDVHYPSSWCYPI